MVKIYTLFQTKTAKLLPFGATHTYITCLREYPPPPPYQPGYLGMWLVLPTSPWLL